MAGKNGGARRGAGRKPGSRSRETIEAELAAVKQQLEVLKRKDPSRKLAIEALDDIMHTAYGMMAMHQPELPGESLAAGRKPDKAEFEKWLGITKDAAKELAPFQTPKYKSVELKVDPSLNVGGVALPVAGSIEKLTPAQAYRMLRDADIIDVDPAVPQAQPAPAKKKRA